MQSYLVTLKPLEPYFFGGERTFHYGTETTMPDTYYIASEKTPNQTALLGTLRYAILDRYGLLWHSGETDVERTLRAHSGDYVGESGFSIDGNNRFGLIERISPLFLRRGETSYLPAPLNYRIVDEKDGGCLRFATLPSSAAENRAPVNYKAKGHDLPAGKYLPVCEKTGEPVDPFLSNVRVGIDTKEKKDGFFKKQYQMLKSGFCFAFYASLDERADVDGYTGTVFMGQGKSPFQIAFRREEDDLETLAKQLLPREENDYWYALSDLWFREKPEHEGFAILLRKQLRYLTTDLDSGTQRNRMNKTAELYNLVQAGSVFYYDPMKLHRQQSADRKGQNAACGEEGEKVTFLRRNVDCVGMNRLIHIEARK
ncbi:MAG: type III-B CRISPR module-associated protein Cmr3 [Clostridiales bacterium]|nr:type III-B CRISPR module-associated protein Cmr3 [Clostridiales bacterium]